MGHYLLPLLNMIRQLSDCENYPTEFLLTVKTHRVLKNWFKYRFYFTKNVEIDTFSPLKHILQLQKNIHAKMKILNIFPTGFFKFRIRWHISSWISKNPPGKLWYFLSVIRLKNKVTLVNYISFFQNVPYQTD